MGRKRSSGAEAVWRERLARFQGGGLTVAEFCRREGVSGPSFYQWRKRLQQGRGLLRETQQCDRSTDDARKTGHFVPVHVSGLTAAVIELPHGVTVRVPVAEVEALRTAILAAGEACGEVRPC
ncbi:MAG: transposase [bacterium]|nr:transposase [bacterium]